MRKLMMTALGVAVLLLATVSPADAQVKPQREPAGSPSCVYVVATSVELPNIARAQRFSARKTSDILLNAVFTEALKGEHVLNLRVYTPHGYLYRQFDVPVAENRGRAPQGRKLEHYPYPVKQQFPEMKKIDDKELRAVSIHLPVAGSNIMTSSLYGSWSVEVLLDGQQQKDCQERFSFIISE